jgi:hypothetical protein
VAAFPEMLRRDRERWGMRARTAIDEATAAGGDPGILAEAEQQMQKAADELANGHVPESIEYYGRAWKKAQEAVM